jgi:6-pyruvoyltetrahydropterin/6-carboxytetrahydropterin synthase
VRAERGYVFESHKTYTRSVGLSCCFWQMLADSHCRDPHGYALEISLTFRSAELNQSNWVQDFGGLKHVKEWLVAEFDHKILIARDDPDLDWARQRWSHCICVVDATGCEAFAMMILKQIRDVFRISTIWSVTVREHEGNAATYRRSPTTGF